MWKVRRGEKVKGKDLRYLGTVEARDGRFTEFQDLGILEFWNRGFLESLELKGFNGYPVPPFSHT